MKATCVLHNYLKSDLTYNEDVECIDAVDFEEPENELTNLSNLNRRPNRHSFQLRDKFADYFNIYNGSLS